MSAPMPRPTPETLPFWEATGRHELSVQYCTDCERHYFYPRPSCPRCGSSAVEWRVVSGRATLSSYIINHRPTPEFEQDGPQIIAIVELEEGVRLLTNLVDVEPDPANLVLDMPLQVRFRPHGEVTLPVFAPAEES